MKTLRAVSRYPSQASEQASSKCLIIEALFRSYARNSTFVKTLAALQISFELSNKF